MKTAIILTAGSCALVASRSYCEDKPTYSTTYGGNVFTCANFQDDFGADDATYCASWGSTPNVGPTSTVAGLTPNMACHACGECDWAPGWTITSSSGPEACHVLDDGCIADDAAGSSAANYAKDEKCVFKYTGDATIALAGNENLQGSHLQMDWTSTPDYVAVEGYQGNGFLSGTNQGFGAFSGTDWSGSFPMSGTKTFIFKSNSDNYVAGGFKICDNSVALRGPAAVPCSPGTVQGAGGSCEPCGIGTYSWRENSQSCETCAEYPTNGAWNHAAGSQTDVNCPWACATGFIASSDGDSCLAQVANCATQVDSTCTQCTTGYSLTHGGTTCSAQGATMTFKAGPKTATLIMHNNGALKLSGGDDICIEAQNCDPNGRRLSEMGDVNTRIDAIEARLAALEAH